MATWMSDMTLAHDLLELDTFRLLDAQKGTGKAPGQLLSMLGALRAGGLMEARTTGRAQHETYEATLKGRTALLTIEETLPTTDADTRLMD